MTKRADESSDRGLLSNLLHSTTGACSSDFHDRPLTNLSVSIKADLSACIFGTVSAFASAAQCLMPISVVSRQQQYGRQGVEADEQLARHVVCH